MKRIALSLASVAVLAATFIAAVASERAAAQPGPEPGGAQPLVLPTPRPIHSCVAQNGEIRIVEDRRGACTGREEPLSWNEQGPRGPKGETGAPGAAGAPGIPGAKGSPGVSGYEIVTAATAENTQFSKELVAACPAGKRAIAGGYQLSQFFSGNDLLITTNAPRPDGSGWSVSALGNPNGGAWGFKAYAVCASVGP